MIETLARDWTRESRAKLGVWILFVDKLASTRQERNSARQRGAGSFGHDEEGETRPIGIIPTSHRDLCRLWDYTGISQRSLFSIVLREIRDKAESQAAFLASRPWRLCDSLGICSVTIRLHPLRIQCELGVPAHLTFAFVRFPSHFQRFNPP